MHEQSPLKEQGLHHSPKKPLASIINGIKSSRIGQLVAVFILVMAVGVTTIASQQKQVNQGHAAELCQGTSTTFPISGRVTDTTGTVPIRNYLIIIYDHTKGITELTLTDKNGYFCDGKLVGKYDGYAVRPAAWAKYGGECPSGYTCPAVTPEGGSYEHQTQGRVGLPDCATGCNFMFASSGPTCIPRPACLDATPPCEIAQPAEGFCPPQPPVSSYILRCSSCPGHRLCFNATSKIAYCSDPSIMGVQGTDTACVTCRQPIITPQPSCAPAPTCDPRLGAMCRIPTPCLSSGGTPITIQKCVFDSDCPSGSVCNASSNSCACAPGTGHGTCTLSTTGAGGSTGGGTGPVGTAGGMTAQ